MSGRRTPLKSKMQGKILVFGTLGEPASKLKALFKKQNIIIKTAKQFDIFQDEIIKKNYHGVIARYRSEGRKFGARIVRLCRRSGVPCMIIGDELSKTEVKEVTNLGAFRVYELPVKPGHLIGEFKKIWRDPLGLIARRERTFDLNMLTEKEKQISRLILKGLKNKEIAEILNSTEGTIKVYSSRIYSKCEVTNRADFFNLIFPT